MRPIVLTALAAVLVSACSSAAPSPPAASATVVPTASPSAPPSPAVTPPPSTAPTAVPSPSASVVGRAPSGPWSAVHWLAAGALPFRQNEVMVGGWSGGFIALEQSPGSDDQGNELPVVIRASQSTDGLHWSAPTTLETGFKGNLAISSIVESPAGLLALGYPYGDTCGGPAAVSAVWASADGRQWDRVAMPKDFTAGRVQTIAGGAAGFIALGVRPDDTTQAIWTSADGRTWRSRHLPMVSSGTLALDEAASIDGGFVLVGSVLGEEGCGGAAHVRFATWFSTDGTAWTRTNLPGAAAEPMAMVHVQRLLGRVVVTQVLAGDDTNPRAWTSPDGRSWTSLGEVSNDIVWGSISDGVHTIQALLPDEGVGPPMLTALDENAARVTLRQDGVGPSAAAEGPSWTYAVGPTGILAVLADGSDSRLGLPS